MATIRDVARTAGVSIATVSAVVNRSAFVSSPLEKRVRAAVAATGYQPDLRARALKTGAGRVLGLVVPGLANAGVAMLVQELTAAVRARDHALLLEISGGEPAGEQASLERLRAQRVAGLLVVAGAGPSGAAGANTVPGVRIGGAADGMAADIVAIDHEAAAAASTLHLAELGHRRIALLAGPAAGWTAPLQLAGYRGQLARLGIAFNPRLVRIGPSRPDHAAASLTALLALAEPPGAVIAGDPAMALGAIGAMAEAKLRYPRDLSLLCLEDADWMAPLGLGAASWSPDRIAATAVGLLFERIARPTTPTRRATIAAALDPRRSCARPVAAGRG